MQPVIAHKAKGRPPFLTVGVLLVVMMVWGYAFVGIKELLIELSPVSLTVGRFGIVFVVVSIGLLGVAAAGKPLKPIHKGDFLSLALLSIFGVAGYHISLNFGEIYATATTASFLAFTTPLFTMVLSMRRLGEQVDVYRIGGTVASLAGVGILIFGGSATGGKIGGPIGALMILGAPLSWSVYTVYGKELSQRVGSFNLSIYTLLFGSIILLPLLGAGALSELLTLSVRGWVILVFLAVVSTIGGYIVWFWALRRMEATQVAAFLYLVPLFSHGFDRVFLRESMTWQVAIGAILVLVGVNLVEHRPRLAAG